MAGLQPFDIRHARIRSDALMHLAMADINRGDVFCTALQQHFRKTAGGSADVETNAAGRIESTTISLSPAACSPTT